MSKAIADGFLRIMSEVKAWQECQKLNWDSPTRCCKPEKGYDVMIVQRELQFPAGHTGRVYRCKDCGFIHVQVILTKELYEVQDDTEAVSDNPGK